jgi:hypothetical protein
MVVAKMLCVLFNVLAQHQLFWDPSNDECLPEE